MESYFPVCKLLCFSDHRIQEDHLAWGVAKRRIVRPASKMKMTKTLAPRLPATFAFAAVHAFRTGGPLTRDVICSSHRTKLSKHVLPALVAFIVSRLCFLSFSARITSPYSL